MSALTIIYTMHKDVHLATFGMVDLAYICYLHVIFLSCIPYTSFVYGQKVVIMIQTGKI